MFLRVFLDVDECGSSSLNNCSANEKCVNEHGSFRCECIDIGQCKGQWLEVANQITCNKALCNMHLFVYCTLLGSFKQPRWRRKRQRQKTIVFMSKTTALHVHHTFLVHFFDVYCTRTTSTWNPLMRLFMEDVNLRRRIFLSRFETG